MLTRESQDSQTGHLRPARNPLERQKETNFFRTCGKAEKMEEHLSQKQIRALLLLHFHHF